MGEGKREVSPRYKIGGTQLRSGARLPRMQGGGSDKSVDTSLSTKSSSSSGFRGILSRSPGSRTVSSNPASSVSTVNVSSLTDAASFSTGDDGSTILSNRSLAPTVADSGASSRSSFKSSSSGYVDPKSMYVDDASIKYGEYKYYGEPSFPGYIQKTPMPYFVQPGFFGFLVYLIFFLVFGVLVPIAFGAHVVFIASSSLSLVIILPIFILFYPQASKKTMPGPFMKFIIEWSLWIDVDEYFKRYTRKKKRAYIVADPSNVDGNGIGTLLLN